MQPWKKYFPGGVVYSNIFFQERELETYFLWICYLTEEKNMTNWEMSRPSKRKLENIFPVAQREIFGNNFQKGDELFYPPSFFTG